MEKRALGKGLDQLMSGQSVVRKSAPPSPIEAPLTSKVTPVDFGRGLNSLVAARAPEKEQRPEVRLLLPAWFFFAGDLLLLTYTVAICLDAGGPLGLGEILFATVSTSIGALLAVAGVLRVVEKPASTD